MHTHDFRLVNYPLRLYSGKDALESLPLELKRQRAARAFIVCGRTVSRKTPLISRMRTILGPACAGVFDEMEKESPLAAIVRARDAAREATADLLIGVGAGSVIQATRVVAILLAEKRPVGEL
ncbi:MAG: iron-containing alcohol dehydrogenase, partial [Burkholderiales bacterium]|nr:iron-containing alcohol dehydrogenase [Burkholderiales bacterium]